MKSLNLIICYLKRNNYGIPSLLNSWNIHRVSKNVPPLACYNFDTRERSLIFLAEILSSQKTLYYATSNNLCFCTTWQNGKHENCIFHSLCALPEFNQLLLDFFNLFDARLIFQAAVWLPKSCNQFTQLGAVGGMVQEKGSRERCSRWTVLHVQRTSALSFGFPLSQCNAMLKH